MMRRRPGTLLMFVLLLGSAGCLRDADPLAVDPDPLQVHAVLTAGADSVTVLVSRPAADRHGYRPVSGAEVRLIHEGAAVRLFERTDSTACAMVGHMPIGGGSGCYTAVLPQRVTAGGVYDLEVLVPGGARVTGTTRVPGPVTITGPDRTTYSIECSRLAGSPPGGGGSCWGYSAGPPTHRLEPLATLELEWTAPAGAGRVEVLFRTSRVERQGTTYFGPLCEVGAPTLYRAVAAPHDGVRWPVQSIHCGSPIDAIGWNTIFLDAIVAAYDAAYGAYMDAVLDRDAARIESLSAGLEGALGVFGSVNVTVREITLTRMLPPEEA
jgi:hypothetical protein